VSSVEGLAAARNLEQLFLDSNRLTNFSLPAILTNLTELDLRLNPITNCSLPSGLAHLHTLAIEFGSLTQLILPPGLTALTELDLGVNALTSFSLPPDATNLAGTVAFLRNQGISVFTYPLAVRLVSPRRTAAGAFEFTLTGPPGSYAVLSSTNLAAWSALGTATNTLGSAIFTDGQA